MTKISSKTGLVTDIFYSGIEYIFGCKKYAFLSKIKGGFYTLQRKPTKIVTKKDVFDSRLSTSWSYFQG